VLIRQFALAALVVAGSSAALLFNEFHAYSSDAGQHYALVRALMDLDKWGSPAATPNLGTLPYYPPVSHWIAAEVGKVFGSGLLGMTLVASASVGLFYLAMFIISFRIDWRAPIIACLITIGYALLRGPVFGRQVVNNYFYAQLVGSTLAALTLLIAFNQFHKWKGPVTDLFVLIMGQIIVATHLMPAEQLIGAYCMVLLVHAWTTSSWTVFVRLMLFSVLSLALSALSPFALNVYAIAQSEGGAHINLLGNRIAQIIFLVVGSAASVKLILQTREKAGAGMFLGCMGLSSCFLAFLQIGLFWIGIGSNYAIAKHMFVTVAFFIFVVSANIALRKPSSSSDFARMDATKVLAWCSILALLTTRVDLYPSILDLNKVVAFQRAVRSLSDRLESEGGRQPIALAQHWPPAIAYGISIGDLRFPMAAADLILEGGHLPQDRVSVVFMPPDDPGAAQECFIPAHSNQDAAAFDYSCIVRSGDARR
jgi:hypothetical protein